MKKFAILILVLVFTPLCAQPLGKPEVKSVKNCWGNITPEKTEILTEILVYNPNPVSLPLKDILTEIYMNDLKMGEGKALKAEMPPGEHVIVISTKIENNKISDWFASHVKNGEKTDLKLKGYIVFDLRLAEFKYPFEQSDLIETDLLSGLNFQDKSKVNVGPVTLTVRSIDSHWGEIEKDQTEIITLATLFNENPIPILIMKFRYDVEMNDIRVAHRINDVATLIPPKFESTLILVTKVDNEMFGKWFVDHLKNGEKSELKVIFEPL